MLADRSDTSSSLASSNAPGVQERVNSNAPPKKQGGEDSSEAAPSRSNRSTPQINARPTKILTLLRIILLDAPLVFLFACFLCVYAVRSVHDTYYRPLFDRAQRTDEQLDEEYTYYHRECTALDLTTHNVADLVLDTTTNVSFQEDGRPSQTLLDRSVEQMLRHGGIVIPQVLKPSSVQRLRRWVVERNSAVTDEEAFPVSQGYNRLSYGIDPTEDDAVADAVQEIANNPYLKAILQEILGDEDPASTEVTAITAYPGCPDQVWHSDTKVVGNALKFARTYSHSYSFFVPLQDTTEAMGATSVAPGTHYCANDIIDMCEANTMGLHEATPQQVFRAGDGALLNQHVWHRGSAHTDLEAPERILFILSFLARPKYGEDPRQLSRGTYFHQKWNMWGHTYKDLMNPMLSMRKPFSILRCLSLWKPKGYNWGYDLVTSGFMRFANEQLEDEDLEDRFLPRLDQLHFPEWLRGSVVTDFGQKAAWQNFIEETLDKLYSFLRMLVVGVHSVYAVFLVLTIIWSSWNSRRGYSSVRRICFGLISSHIVLLLLTFYGLYRVRTSEWGQNVLSGKMLMRPFPSVSKPRGEEVTVSDGPTTLPQRSDVLIGSRYDAEFLGSYDRWLDFHHGNVHFRDTIQETIEFYTTSELQSPLSVLLSIKVKKSVTENNGRFLHQDYRTGDWRVMTDEEAAETIEGELLAIRNQAIAAIRREIDYEIAKCRFGPGRETALARAGMLRLWNLRKKLLAVRRSALSARPLHNAPTTSLAFQFRLAKRTAQLRTHITGKTNLLALNSRSLSSLSTEDFFIGMPVWVHFEQDGFYYSAELVDAGDAVGSFVVSYLEDPEYEYDVSRSRLLKRSPLVEGEDVMSCFGDEMNDCWKGTVLRVMPSGIVSVVFEDGEVIWKMQPLEVYQPPYRFVIAVEEAYES